MQELNVVHFLRSLCMRKLTVAQVTALPVNSVHAIAQKMHGGAHGTGFPRKFVIVMAQNFGFRREFSNAIVQSIGFPKECVHGRVHYTGFPR